MFSKPLTLLSLAATLTLTTPAVAAVPANPIDLTYAAEKAVNSVVYIKVVTNSRTQTITGFRDPFEDFFGDFFGRGGGSQQRKIQTPKRTGAGSGVILTEDGYIVTNNHVVQEADEITVKLNDNREFKARIIGTDATTDLALIKVETKDLPAIKVASSDDLKLGQWVLAIGNPFSLTSTVTAGIVSAKARSLGAKPGDKVNITYMRDKKTHTATLTLRNIPGTTTAVKTVDTEAMGAAMRALTDKEKEELGLSYGLLITAIRDGKMKEAGLSKGLIILKVNDKEMRTIEDFEDITKQANLSTERVLWIRARTQSGYSRSFAVELSEDKDNVGAKK